MLDVTKIWDERKKDIDKFMGDVVVAHIDLSLKDRVLLECFWTFLMTQNRIDINEVIHGQE